MSITEIKPTRSEAYTYDALGRLITDTSSGGQPTTNVCDDSGNPILEYESSTVVTRQYGIPSTTTSTSEMRYLWSGADGRIIARETVGSKLVYALTDAQGSVTSLVDNVTLPGQSGPSWQVAERYQYNADGVPTAYDANWHPISTVSPTSIGAYGWTILWHGQMWQGLNTFSAGTVHGLYHSIIGENWYDPQEAKALAPSADLSASGGYRYTDAQLNADPSDNFEDALLNPGGFGSAGNVTQPEWINVASTTAEVVGVVALTTYGFACENPDGKHLLLMHFSGNRKIPPVPQSWMQTAAIRTRSRSSVGCGSSQSGVS